MGGYGGQGTLNSNVQGTGAIAAPWSLRKLSFRANQGKSNIFSGQIKTLWTAQNPSETN